MIDIPVLGGGIHKLNSRTRRHQEIIGGFGNVTTVMKPIGTDIGGEFYLHLSGMQIPSGKDTGVPTRCRWGTPDHALHDQNILRRLISTAGMRSFPELFAGLGIKGLHQAISACVENNPVVSDEFGAKIEPYLFRDIGFTTGPGDITRRTISSLYFFPIMKIEVVLIG